MTSEVLINPEKSVEWYNWSWEKSGWHDPAAEEGIRHLYVLQELRHLKVDTILDVCCGQGTFLTLCERLGFTGYGFDFSSVAINIAKQNNKLENVWVGDALDKKNYDGEYDAYVSIQVLEHIEKDIDVILNLKPNTPFVFSVPNWAHPGDEHVRKFVSDESIHRRYGGIVDIKTIQTFGNRRVVVSKTRSNV